MSTPTRKQRLTDLPHMTEQVVGEIQEELEAPGLSKKDYQELYWALDEIQEKVVRPVVAELRRRKQKTTP